MNGKRGQGLSTSAIVLIVLGVIVLVILVLGFTIGWNKLVPFVKTNNVDNIKTSCGLACSTGNQYDFCVTNRTVNDGAHAQFVATCDKLSNAEDAFYKANSFVASYGIDVCPSITCPTTASG